ncbi:MAG: hypothetical protein M3P30_04055 [Chloroflexota bacterium]|nr:hypothetical protein [Chloroflexota bacterium]
MRKLTLLLALLAIAAPTTLWVASHPVQAKGGATFTYRISGGDLPHPVTVSLVEAMNATSGFTSAASEYERTGVPPPDPGTTRYRVEDVPADDLDVAPSTTPQLHVLGNPSLMSDPVASQRDSWTVPVAAVRDVLDRYIILARRGALPEHPTFAQAIAAAGHHLPARTQLGGATLSDDETNRVLTLLRAAEPVEFGVRGKQIGQRPAGGTELRIELGGGSLTFRYVRPGIVAPFGLLFDPARANNWQYTTLLDPPGYSQIAYTVPADFDALMSDLGIAGIAPSGIVETRVVPFLRAQHNDVGDVARVEVWRDGGESQQISADLFDGNCIPSAGCAAPRPLEPFSGDPLVVEEQFGGIDPFPDAVRPARYLYYPGDSSGTGRGVLVQTQVGAVLNGTFGDITPPFYAAEALDRVLRDIEASPSAAPQGQRSSRQAVEIAAASAAVLIALLAAASVVTKRTHRKLPFPRREGAGG